MKSRVMMAGVLAAAISGSAMAEEPGFFAGSGLGMYFIDVDDIDFDENAEALRVFGGYRMNEYVSFEVGYSKLFEASGDAMGFDVETDGSAFDVAVRPSMPLADNFTAFAVLGWSRYDMDVKVSNGLVSVSDSDKDSAFTYGIGGAFDINDNWTVRGEWSAVDVDGGDLSMLGISAVYNFR